MVRKEIKPKDKNKLNLFLFFQNYEKKTTNINSQGMNHEETKLMGVRTQKFMGERKTAGTFSHAFFLSSSGLPSVPVWHWCLRPCGMGSSQQK